MGTGVGVGVRLSKAFCLAKTWPVSFAVADGTQNGPPPPSELTDRPAGRTERYPAGPPTPATTFEGRIIEKNYRLKKAIEKSYL
jgi:hypothetical protein